MTRSTEATRSPSTHEPRFKSFEESTAEDWAIITPQLNVTQSFVADRVIQLIRDLEIDHGGFPVNRLEHSLQTATRAERDGQDDEYVLCALLHDIGDTLSPFNHPEIAASILKPFVSEANYFMVKNHGAFQGYYFWHYIGLDQNAREAVARLAVLRPHRRVLREVRPDRVRRRLHEQPARALRTADPPDPAQPLSPARGGTLDPLGFTGSCSGPAASARRSGCRRSSKPPGGPA